ncbi:MAG: cytochrome c3 family protein [Coriobacteriales bacterium]|nr:hypothetical protein [Actinomycetes bacterium]
MTLRRISTLGVIAALAVVVLLVPSTAFANYAIHGSYTMDTDACAGCHRAHTAASPIQWTTTTGTEGGSALLMGTAATIDEFCNTCHGTASSGADTNVVDGIFDADDGDDTGADRVLNAAGEKLNGGGFNIDPTSGSDIFWTQHAPDGSSWTAWGGGDDGADGIISIGGQEDVSVGCSVCHDVHGSANYRLLKHTVNGVVVGNYTGDPVDPTPVPWVVSAEPGYPSGGWLLHEPGAAQVAAYQPDYTTARYAKAPGGDPTKGISAWCSACHRQYMTTSGTVDVPGTGAYDAADGFGLVVRHRHPINVPLSNFADKLHPGQLVLAQGPVGTGNPLPLAHDSSADWAEDAAAATNDASDWVDCLTCHVAHGASTLMTGYAAVENNLDPQPGTGYEDINGDGVPDEGAGGVAPAYSNALLRYDNRTVCEVCHNK